MIAALTLASLLVAALPPPLDSQAVLDGYSAALANLVPPKAMIFVYSVSQAGPTNIEQRHQIYRSGVRVRDETLSINGVGVKRKTFRIERRADPYDVTALAPRPDAYEMLFLKDVRDGNHRDYVYETQPLLRASTGFVVDRVTIDGESLLPRIIGFHTTGANASGQGTITFGRASGHWVPLVVSVNALVAGAVARERIVFGDYRFPPALPRSTFL